MIVTVEISLYPLQEDYKDVIIAFIKRLREHDEITCRTTEMSTLVKGEWSSVMSILEQELGDVYPLLTNSATILKIIPKDLPIENGYVNW
jgi:uncharacterized protein YqgV (UPF0045/DUF77 family)